MAIYTTFFLAGPSDLAVGFPGWKPPRSEPIRERVTNPFTGESRDVERWAPAFPQDDDSAPPRAVVVAIEGDYAAYLEGRLPPFVRARPHWAIKGVTDIALRPLVAAAGQAWIAVQPLYAPPSVGAALITLPEGFGGWPRAEHDRLARAWAEAMSTPEHTHSVSGKRIEPDWEVEGARALIDGLVQLASSSAPSERMYLLIEP